MADQKDKVNRQKRVLINNESNMTVNIVGDYCKPCQCSGNINPEDPSSCDTVTGNCLRCLNNTFGEACALCAPGFFGDAVNLKDCQGIFSVKTKHLYFHCFICSLYL